MAHITAPTPATAALRRARSIARQRGLTLIELMVALVVGLMVIMAAMSVFTSSSQSARSVDHASQLRDDARFAAEVIQRLAVQTGFEDIGFVTRTYQGTPQTYKAANGLTDPLTMQAPIFGFAGKPSGQYVPNTNNEIQAGSGTAPGGSDTLVLRYQAVNKKGSLGDADKSMMLCNGQALGDGDGHDSERRTERAVSIFYVDQPDGETEPTLYCRYTVKEKAGSSLSAPIPLVKGVESFKVLYGVDNIEKNTAADCSGGSGACATEHAKLIPNRYLTAADLTVGTDTAATQTNWRRVRALRVGIVLRGAGNSGNDIDNSEILPLGEKFGGAYTPADTLPRLRQNHIFTVNLRNCLNQGYQPAGNPGDTDDDLKDIPPCDVVVPRGVAAATS